MQWISRREARARVAEEGIKGGAQGECEIWTGTTNIIRTIHTYPI